MRICTWRHVKLWFVEDLACDWRHAQARPTFFRRLRCGTSRMATRSSAGHHCTVNAQFSSLNPFSNMQCRCNDPRKRPGHGKDQSRLSNGMDRKLRSANGYTPSAKASAMVLPGYFARADVPQVLFPLGQWPLSTGHGKSSPNRLSPENDSTMFVQPGRSQLLRRRTVRRPTAGRIYGVHGPKFTSAVSGRAGDVDS